MARAATVVDGVLAARGSAMSNRLLGARLGVSEKRVRVLRVGEAPWHIGDLLLLPRSLALAVLDALRAEVDRRGPPASVDAHVRRLAVATGGVAAAVDAAVVDGVVDDGERRSIAHAALEVDRHALACVRDLAPGGCGGAR